MKDLSKEERRFYSRLLGGLFLVFISYTAVFIIGMRAGMQDRDTMLEKESEALTEQYNLEIDQLRMELEQAREEEHVTIEYTYTPVSTEIDIAEITELEESDLIILAKTMWGEYRDSTNYNQCAAVCWCILNRVDAGYGTISEVATTGQYHGYSKSNPVDVELYKIVLDVVARWQLEKIGANNDVGRVIPSDYLWMHGNGRVNTYRNAYQGGDKITP